MSKSSDTATVIHRDGCPFTWCTASSHTPDSDGTTYHSAEPVEIAGLGSFQLYATTGAPAGDEPPTVLTRDGEWTLEEARAAAEEFSRVIGSMASATGH